MSRIYRSGKNLKAGRVRSLAGRGRKLESRSVQVGIDAGGKIAIANIASNRALQRANFCMGSDQVF